jgi:prepilin-type N-terminal cleavage/methylation domain-containing protein/prepilin-type processing-associated H-X9-DG protein
MMVRRKGFTLIELLVVIAIIGILAAMLFPVFARAREAARKIQCLSNVKNIAMAVQMYLVDYDRFFPKEHDATVRQFFKDNGCSDDGADCYGTDCRSTAPNPYLKHPVILDEYIKNRDVWRCPSARYVKSFSVNWGYGDGRWFRYLMAATDAGACYMSFCSPAYPPGWGGDITDSWVQEGCSTGANAFVQQIACPWTLDDMSTSAIKDPAKQVACADAGVIIEQLDRTSWVAYPDVCRIDSALCYGDPSTCGADWTNCSWSRDCGPLAIDHGGDGRIAGDVEYRKSYGRPRHLGGSNLGFADGHAKWMSSEAILFGGENGSGYAKEPPDLLGLACCFTPDKVNKYGHVH